ncbi:MAG: 30S ribosomal protein S6e [ANME-2 cluster archaeon]|nr:30S ribosomal protein S6e [ANME-2 cluster archaeon]MDF1531433.1 30S ribosomal protein S6e [ANME-2 cluster archaeon]MDW7775876.1 30S ribosomal protein S6e [Methanosarcinales archaeon]
MADFRVIVSDRKTGHAHQIQISDNNINNFIGKNIGDIVKGDAVNLPGYSLKITGGTDNGGFPMRSGLPGPSRRKVLVSGGVGFKTKVDGMRRRKAIRGEEIASDIGQINTVIEDYGSKSIHELLGGGAEAGEGAADESK